MQNEYPLLDNLSGPESLRSMDVPTLNRLADEVRDGLVRTIAKVGGHFAPNLGVIELTIAMYHAYGIPEDKVIWDVGHQCYPHKMLTGRWKQLSSIKQYGGISGYLRRDESKYDLFGAGHASTSLSAALGFAKARDLRGTKEHVLAVITICRGSVRVQPEYQQDLQVLSLLSSFVLCFDFAGVWSGPRGGEDAFHDWALWHHWPPAGEKGIGPVGRG